MFPVSPSLDGLMSSLGWSVPKGAVLGTEFQYHFTLKEREQVD